MSTTTISSSTNLGAISLGIGEDVIIDGGSGVTVSTAGGLGNVSLLDSFTVEDNATLQLSVDISAAVLDTFTIGSDGTLEVASGISASVLNDISFEGGATGGDLILDQGADIKLLSNISGFGYGDTIDFQGLGAPTTGTVGMSFDSMAGVTTFTVDTTSGTQTFQLAGDYSGDRFTATADTTGGFMVSEDTPPCFAQGTHILTPEGEVAVERLKVGDDVVLHDGETAAIVFIGKRRIDLTRHRSPDAARPVRIPAGALEDGVPCRELLLSPDHALFIDNVLVPARDLIDGLTIRRDVSLQTVTYYHVELAAHGVIIAEGAPAESFLDCGHRGLFENSGAPMILHPEFMVREREEKSCAPLVTGGKKLASIRYRLHARALMRGHTVVESALVTLKVGNEPVIAPDDTGGWKIFAIPPGTTRATLLCPAFSPAEVDPASTDRRVLGLAIADISVDGRAVPVPSIIDDRDLHARGAGETAIWTRGPARLNIPPGTTELSLNIKGWPKLWQSLRVAA